MNEALAQRLATLAGEFAALMNELKTADTASPTEEQVRAIAEKLRKLPPRYFQSAADYVDFLAQRKGGLGGGGTGPIHEYP